MVQNKIIRHLQKLKYTIITIRFISAVDIQQINIVKDV